MLSFIKLEKLLAEKGLVIKALFTIDNACMFIELMSIQTSMLLFLYISSKFDIRPTNDCNYPLIPMNYSSSINTQVETQLKRLQVHITTSYCKICIIYQDTLSYIDRHNTIQAVQLTEISPNNQKRLHTLIYLEHIYTLSQNNIDNDITQLEYTVQSVLCQDIEDHIKTIQALNPALISVTVVSRILSSHTEFSRYIFQLETLYTKLVTSEKMLYEKSMYLTSGTDFQQNLENMHHSTKIDAELNKIYLLKHDVITNLFSAKSKRDNILLTLDSILDDI